MARKTINIGTTGNDATGDSIREGFNKVNQNFTEVYSKLGLEGGLNVAQMVLLLLKKHYKVTVLELTLVQTLQKLLFQIQELKFR